MIPKKDVNLLPVSDFEKSFLGKTFLWFVNIGRYIVIATELIVIVAFFSRFKLDKDLADINDSIKQNQAVLSSYQELETNFRLLQAQLNIIGSLEKSQLNASERMSLISRIMPPDIYLTNFDLDRINMSFEGVALSDVSLAGFLSSLSKTERFTDINLTHLNTSGAQKAEIKFGIILKVKEVMPAQTQTKNTEKNMLATIDY